MVCLIHRRTTTSSETPGVKGIAPGRFVQRGLSVGFRGLLWRLFLPPCWLLGALGLPGTMAEITSNPGPAKIDWPENCRYHTVDG